ncbi:MAG: penicillin-binding protein 2 [Verrucomicrobia bacterium]|nr:penicillin-binding protein 2 [Verrucomicrobiota bacterium]
MARAGIPLSRLLWVFTAFVIGFAAVLTRLVDLQFVERDALVEESERIRTKFELLDARRGNIFDRNRNLLATTVTVRRVGVDPESLLPEDKPNWHKLAKLIHVPYSDLYQKMKGEIRMVDGNPKTVRWKVLADNIDEKVYREVLKLGIDGVYGNRHFKRVYPVGALASHVLGYVNKEEQAVTGVEHAMDFYLKGQTGWIETEWDGKRREMAQFRKRQVEATDGFHVSLTIDMMVQHVLELELKSLIELKPNGVTIIVSDPATGYILGMANWPTFDPNEYFNTVKYPISYQRNLAISDIYEPGSIFKIVPIGAALSEEIINPYTTFNCSLDRVPYRGRVVRLPSDHDGKDYGTIPVLDIIAHSSNRGAAQVGILLGEERLYSYAKAFGFGEKTGFLLGPERDGILHEPKNWDGLTISRLPMGQAIAVTPLQAHFAMSVLANDGVLMMPQILSRVEDADGNVISTIEPKAIRRVISASAARSLSKMLVKTVSPEGTAPHAQIPGMEVAGKTGTAQRVLKQGGYSATDVDVSFIGYFPASDPRLVITVVIYNPQKGSRFGGQLAAPAFKRVSEHLIHLLGISPKAPIRGFLVMDEQE